MGAFLDRVFSNNGGTSVAGSALSGAAMGSSFGPIGAGIGAGIGALGGAALNYYGAQKANESNLAIAREQMGFQERMSNTAHQRQILDLQAAGLNPALSLNAGGASSPGGASATMQNQMSGAVSSARELMQMGANLKQTNIMNDILKAELAGKQVEADLYNSKAGKSMKFLQMMVGPINSALSLRR